MGWSGISFFGWQKEEGLIVKFPWSLIKNIIRQQNKLAIVLSLHFNPHFFTSSRRTIHNGALFCHRNSYNKFYFSDFSQKNVFFLFFCLSRLSLSLYLKRRKTPINKIICFLYSAISSSYFLASTFFDAQLCV